MKLQKCFPTLYSVVINKTVYHAGYKLEFNFKKDKKLYIIYILVIKRNLASSAERFHSYKIFEKTKMNNSENLIVIVCIAFTIPQK